MTQSLLPEPESSPIEKGDAEAASSGADTTSARSAGSALRRPGRGWRIALLSVLAIFLVLTLATGGLALWVRHSIASGIEFIADPFAGIPARAPQQKVAAGEEPAVNILVLGTDSRTSASDPSQWKEGAQRTDAIMIVQVSGDRKTVSVMSIPRDSWVEIPGHGQGKINAAYSYGGPSLTIHTVENLTGIHIDHFAVANFESFVALTDEIGGVRINLKTLRNNTSYAFRLSDLIEGWIIALQQMCIGDRWEVYLPAELAYGRYAQPGIPAGSTLIFELELVSIA